MIARASYRVSPVTLPQFSLQMLMTTKGFHTSPPEIGRLIIEHFVCSTTLIRVEDLDLDHPIADIQFFGPAHWGFIADYKRTFITNAEKSVLHTPMFFYCTPNRESAQCKSKELGPLERMFLTYYFRYNTFELSQQNFSIFR